MCITYHPMSQTPFSGGFGFFHRFPVPPDSVYTSMEALNQTSTDGSDRYQPQPSRTNPNVVFRRPNDMNFGLLYWYPCYCFVYLLVFYNPTIWFFCFKIFLQSPIKKNITTVIINNVHRTNEFFKSENVNSTVFTFFIWPRNFLFLKNNDLNYRNRRNIESKIIRSYF